MKRIIDWMQLVEATKWQLEIWGPRVQEKDQDENLGITYDKLLLITHEMG